ncbi:MAG: winged helix DNA-binding domain-containing protein [Rubrivivax sp.]|nr:winged helix DNA-binding domain-containing protein [Rubrivivax sp.]
MPRAIAKLGFVQADPIRAPARAQDLTLRHRVAGYRAGDLERRYARLPIEEDFFVNYGFLPRATHHLMHPRTARSEWTQARWTQAHEVLAFVRQHGVVHLARWTRPSTTARRATGLAAATPARSCSTACTTAACCASPGARAACACMRRATRTKPHGPGRGLRHAGGRGAGPVRAAARISLNRLVSRVRYGAPQWNASGARRWRAASSGSPARGWTA